MAVGAAAVWAGVRAALWFPGCVARRPGAGCRARFSFCPVLAALVFSPASRRVDHLGRLCVSVCWGRSLGMRGSLSHLPRRRRPHCLWLPTREAIREQWRGPRGGAREARRLRPPTSRGRGCRSPLSSLLFGAPRLPLSPSSRPECQTGGGDEPTTSPSRFPWKPLGGDAAPPPRSGTRRTPGVLGADSPPLSSSSPSPRLTRPPPAPLESDREWRAQVRGQGALPPLGHLGVLSGSRSQREAGIAGGVGVGGCC